MYQFKVYKFRFNEVNDYAKAGGKQSVLKKGISNKRKGFKGVQKQTVNITFVGEDDVMSEMIPPPAISVSSRKLGACAVDTSSSDESI